MANKKWPIVDLENIKSIDDIGFLGDPYRTPAQREADAKLTSLYIKKMKEKDKRDKAGSGKTKAIKTK